MAAKIPAAGVDLDGAITINESSADVDFRIESNGNTHALFVDAGNDVVGIGAASPSTTFRTSIYGDGSSVIGGIEFRNATSGGETFTIGHAGVDSTSAKLNVVGAGVMRFDTSDTERMRITSSGTLGIGDSSPDSDAGGLTLNQGANDARILTLKSSDIAHGQTSGFGETDTYFRIQKESSAAGGAFVQGISESSNIEGLKLSGYFAGTSGNTGKSTTQSSPLVLQAMNSDGSGDSAELGSNQNMVCILNRNTCRFIFDAEGDFHADSSSTTYDAYEDAHLVRAYDLSHGKGVIDSKFDKFVSYNHEKLADLQLVGREDDGTPNHFINVTGMQRLHNGAIWQQYEKHQRLAEAVYEMAKEALGKDKADAILEKHDIKLLN
jgi:hypothetical protein